MRTSVITSLQYRSENVLSLALLHAILIKLQLGGSLVTLFVRLIFTLVHFLVLLRLDNGKPDIIESLIWGASATLLILVTLDAVKGPH